MNSALEYSTKVVQEGGRRCKKSTLNDLVHLTPLRIPLMNPPFFSRQYHTAVGCNDFNNKVGQTCGCLENLFPSIALKTFKDYFRIVIFAVLQVYGTEIFLRKHVISSYTMYIKLNFLYVHLLLNMISKNVLEHKNK